MSLLATVLQDIREDSNLDHNERRSADYGALQLAMNQTISPTGIASPELRAAARTALGRTLQVPVINYSSETVTVGGALSVTIPNVENTSALVTITFVPYSFGFHAHPAKHYNNEIGMQRDVAAKLETFELDLLDKLDQAVIAQMETAKTQVLADTLGGRYALTANVIVAPLAEQEFFIGDINPLFRGNKHRKPISMVANPSMESHVRTKLGEKGQYNSENKAYQYMDKDWYFSLNVTDDAAHKATAFAVSGANLAMLQQFEIDALLGSETHKHKWDIETLPFSGLQMGTFEYDDAIDGTGLAGAATAHLGRTKMHAFGFAGYFGFMTAYNSDPATIASPIAKVAISKT